MLFTILILGLLVVDQAVKLLIRSNMVVYESIPVIPNIFHITYVENPGAAFGILANHRLLFLVLCVFIVGVLTYLYTQLKNKKSAMAVSLALIISGALGNAIDRLLRGSVTDMFDFRIWPVFNVADIAICVGLALFAILIIKGEDF